MTSKTRLTANRVLAFACPENLSQTFLNDTDTKGLALRATIKGNKAFVFETKLNRKTIRVTIGDVSIWTIEDARKEARRLKMLCDAGTDPRFDKVEKLAANQARLDHIKRQQLTLGDVWQRYLESQRHRWGERHYQDHIRLVHRGGTTYGVKIIKMTKPAVLADLLDCRLSDLSSNRLEQWLNEQTAQRPTQAALAFRLLRACLNWCEEQSDLVGLIPKQSHQTKKVRQAVPKSNARDDCLQKEQLACWFSAVQSIPNLSISTYLQVLLLIGSRCEELMELRWENVDFDWHSIRLRDKVMGERTIPLTPYVATLLNRLPRTNEWVFASNRAACGHLVDPRNAYEQAMSQTNLPYVSLHGLRRSFGTLSEWVEVPTGVVAQIMGHQPSALAEKHYRRRPLDLLRSKHILIEQWILQQAEITD